jgi:hypothetical protein
VVKRVALVAVMGIVVSACGGARSRPAPTSAVSRPAPNRGAAPVRGTPLDEARLAERDGRAVDALAIYEREAAAGGDAPAKLAALLGAVRLRLAADPATRDLRKAQSLLETAEQTSAAASVPMPVRDLLQLLHEAADLRAQLRAARADMKSLEAEMAKKDDALRRVTSAVVSGKTP